LKTCHFYVLYYVDTYTFVRGSASMARQPIRKRPHNDRVSIVKRHTGSLYYVKTFTLDSLHVVRMDHTAGTATAAAAVATT